MYRSFKCDKEQGGVTEKPGEVLKRHMKLLCNSFIVDCTSAYTWFLLPGQSTFSVFVEVVLKQLYN